MYVQILPLKPISAAHDDGEGGGFGTKHMVTYASSEKYIIL